MDKSSRMNSRLMFGALTQELASPRECKTRMRNNQQDLGCVPTFCEVTCNHGRCLGMEGRVEVFLIFDEHEIATSRCPNAGDFGDFNSAVTYHARSDRFSNFADPSFHCTCFIRLRGERKAGVPLCPLWSNSKAITTEDTEVHRGSRPGAYNGQVEKKIFWGVFIILGLIADVVLP